MFPARCRGRGRTSGFAAVRRTAEFRFAAGRRWLQALASPGWFPHVGAERGEQLVSLPLTDNRYGLRLRSTPGRRISSGHACPACPWGQGRATPGASKPRAAGRRPLRQGLRSRAVLPRARRAFHPTRPGARGRGKHRHLAIAHYSLLNWNKTAATVGQLR